MLVFWYAGIERNGRRSLLRGPFGTREDAESSLPNALRIAETVDAWVHFDVPGVFRVETESVPPIGVLDKMRLNEDQQA